MPEEVVITVATKKSKTKGGFDIVDTLGNKYLLSLGKSSLAVNLLEGRASKIEVAQTSYGKYINKAILFDGLPPAEKRVEPITAGAEPVNSLVKEAIKLGFAIVPEKKPSQEMSKEDWAEKDRVTRKSIERQKSLELAVEVAKIKASDSTEKIIATAKMFEDYIEKGG